MHITVTGATGFVGINLCPYLENKGFSIQQISLRNKDWQNSLSENSSAIVHLAGKAHDTKNTSNTASYFEINTQLTKQLFDAFLKSEAKDFIYFSSVKAVVDTVLTILYEDALVAPQTPYGQSKLKAEQYILSKVLPLNKRVFIIRPCMIHGPGNKGNLNLLYKVVQKEIPYPLAAFNNQRSFLSIDNLNFLVHQMLQNTAMESGIYNFADDEAISTNELIAIVAAISNKRPRLLKVPKGIVRALATIGDFAHLPLNTENVKKLTENYRVSNQKIKKALHVTNLPFNAREGLKKTIQSFIN